MTMDVRVKFCGLTRPQDMAAAVSAGAHYVGLNFFPKSPRYVSPARASELAADLPPGVCKVALTVDADTETLDQIVAQAPVDMLQLHGGESPARVRELKARYGLPVMKVIGVSDAEDVAKIDQYASCADQIMVDAKPPKNAVLPGGNGVAFDWRLIAGRRWPLPWMLAGGLTPDNVAEAVRLTGARQVDVSSGIESAPGTKDAAKMRAFAAALSGAAQQAS